MTRLLMEIPEIWKTLFLLLATTGVRIGEALALRWMEVDFKLQHIRISHTLFRGVLQEAKTESSRRHVPVTELLLDALDSRLRTAQWTRPGDFVFHPGDGKPLDPNWLRKKVLYPAMDRAKIPRYPRQPGFHLFRHTVASLVHKKTGSSKLAQQLLGYSDPSLTKKIYIHPDDEELRKALRTVTDAVFCPQNAHTDGSSSGWVN